MKRKYLALKLYLLGLTAGLFVLGWSVIARADSTQATAAATVSNQTVVRQSTTTGRTFQTQAPNLQPIPAMPRFRTRTS